MDAFFLSVCIWSALQKYSSRVCMLCNLCYWTFSVYEVCMDVHICMWTERTDVQILFVKWFHTPFVGLIYQHCLQQTSFIDNQFPQQMN